MYEVAKRSAALAAATGGLLLAGAACASADAATLPALGAADVLSGNTVEIPVNVPVNLCGIGLLGMSANGASCSSTAAVAVGGGGGTGGGSASSADVLSGNSVSIPVTVPADVCGIGLLGMSADDSACSSNSAAAVGSGGGGGTASSSSVLSGNSVSLPVTAPANVCDVGLLGMSANGASCSSTAAVAAGGGGGTGGGSASSADVLSGNSVSIPVTVPANVCGIGLLGMSADDSACSSTGAAATGGGGGSASSADVLSGNSVSAPVTVPANVCDIGLLGMSANGASCSSAGGAATGGGGATTSTPSTVSGNATQALPAAASVPGNAQSADTAPAQSSALGTAEAVSLPLSSVVPLATSAIGALHDSSATDAPFHPTSSAARPGSGRLAETGVEGLLPMSMAGGGALLSGGVLTALAFKGKHDTTDF